MKCFNFSHSGALWRAKGERPLRVIAGLCALALVVAGCLPSSRYYKTGGTDEDWLIDQAACEEASGYVVRYESRGGRTPGARQATRYAVDKDQYLQCLAEAGYNTNTKR